MGAKKILEKNKTKVLNCEINNNSITQDYNTEDRFII